MALSIPCSVGTEVSISDAARADWEGGPEECHDILSAARMRCNRNERASGSCSSAAEGAAQAIDIGADGRPERTYSDSTIQHIPESSKEALLGKSFLGEGVLRGHSRAEQ